MNVYNTLSGAVETIEPSGRAITLYVCGITPYDTTHLGHAFTYTVADVFVRHLESRGLTNLLKHWSPDALRLYLGQHYYRIKWNYDPDQLADAAQLAEKLRAAVTVSGGEGDPLHVAGAEADFTAAMDDDLSTPSALGTLASLADDVLAAARAGRRVEAGQALVRRLAHVFGLRLDRLDTEERVTRGWDAHLRRFPSL